MEKWYFKHFITNSYLSFNKKDPVVEWETQSQWMINDNLNHNLHIIEFLWVCVVLIFLIEMDIFDDNILQIFESFAYRDP